MLLYEAKLHLQHYQAATGSKPQDASSSVHDLREPSSKGVVLTYWGGRFPNCSTAVEHTAKTTNYNYIPCPNSQRKYLQLRNCPDEYRQTRKQKTNQQGTISKPCNSGLSTKMI